MRPLISTSELAQQLLKEKLVLVDARFRLLEPDSGRRLFLEGHIPGAQHADMNGDLSGVKTGTNGRHPFPEKNALCAVFSRLGIGDDTHVVVYDDTDHAGAARAWALFRWMGHERVRVLDGGFKAWSRESRPSEKGEGRKLPLGNFSIRPSLLTLFSRADLGGKALIDVRAPERYRGEQEPIDPRAGHIPRAKNLPYSSLMQADGTFRSPEEIAELLDRFPPEPIFYCGSGITGCVPLLAAAMVGREVALYPGGWSEWCLQPDAPLAKGTEE